VIGNGTVPYFSVYSALCAPDGSQSLPVMRRKLHKPPSIWRGRPIVRRRLPSPIRPFEVVPAQLVVAAKRVFSLWWAMNAAVRPGEEACAASEN
jgi:hypothetical protein